jgi:hypothetical protein
MSNVYQMDTNEIEEERQGLVRAATEIEVVDEASFVRCGHTIAALKELGTRVKNYFGPMKAAAYKTWKEICGTESNELDKVNAAIALLWPKMQAWKAEQERKRQEAVRAADETTRLMIEATPVAPKVEGITARADWDFEIVDETAIPREFLCPDEAKIRKHIKRYQSEANIRGVRVFRVERVVKIG